VQPDDSNGKNGVKIQNLSSIGSSGNMPEGNSNGSDSLGCSKQATGKHYKGNIQPAMKKQ